MSSYFAFKMNGKINIFSKGTEQEVESYSIFEEKQFINFLKLNKAKRLFICGLATEYCVLATALDANNNNFLTCVIDNAIAGISSEKAEGAKKKMLSNNIKLIHLQELL